MDEWGKRFSHLKIQFMKEMCYRVYNLEPPSIHTAVFYILCGLNF